MLLREACVFAHHQLEVGAHGLLLAQVAAPAHELAEEGLIRSGIHSQRLKLVEEDSGRRFHAAGII